MSIISAESLGLRFGDREIFSNISVDLARGERVGLVGPNGVGKTSLLRILAGLAPPSSGSTRRARDLQIGYLHQEAVEAFAGRAHSVYDEMLTVFAAAHHTADRLRAMEARMAEGESDDGLLAEYSAAQEAFERLGGYDYDVRIQQVLEGLGFPRAAWTTPLDHLSGGQKTRALLARLLLQEPELLILDEPTNHLDVAAVAWLEGALRVWKGTAIVVSHDRSFLDAVVDRIWEMAPTHIERYRGNYSAYVRQRQERWERNDEMFRREMERLQGEMEIIRRYHAWRKFDERDGRLKRLGRHLLAIEQFGVLGAMNMRWSEVGVRSAKIMELGEAHQRIREIRPPAARPPVLHLDLKPARRSGDVVLRTRDLRVGYPDLPLFTADDVTLDRGERVAIIGPNGAGKTTLLRTLLGDLQPLEGEIRFGQSVTVGYFAQAHDALHSDSTVLDELMRHKLILPREARDHLARYLFRGDDVFKAVGALSGGERARLALAILALEGVNVLVLDEPTNHLDIFAQEVLQEGLESFDGTLLLVSHDRYLVRAIATQIWNVCDGHMSVFKGTYAEFEAPAPDAQPNGKAPATARADVRLTRNEVKPTLNGAQSAPDETRQTRNEERTERRRQRLLSALEEKIAEAERDLAEYGRRLESGSYGGDFVEANRLSEAYATTQARVEQLLSEWEAVAAE